MPQTGHSDGTGPFITAYGEAPLVVLTEHCGPDQLRASVVRPPELAQTAQGRSWAEAHWELFNTLLAEYMNLDRNRLLLSPRHLSRLIELDGLRDDGTLKLIASIARQGFPPELHGDGPPAPPWIGPPS